MGFFVLQYCRRGKKQRCEISTATGSTRILRIHMKYRIDNGNGCSAKYEGYSQIIHILKGPACRASRFVSISYRCATFYCCWCKNVQPAAVTNNIDMFCHLISPLLLAQIASHAKLRRCYDDDDDAVDAVVLGSLLTVRLSVSVWFYYQSQTHGQFDAAALWRIISVEYTTIFVLRVWPN